MSSPCKTAAELVRGDRRAQYGGIREGFDIVAKMWSALLGTEVSVHDVCRCMIALKLSRDTLVHKDDNLIDICGYAELSAMMREEKEEDANCYHRMDKPS